MTLNCIAVDDEPLALGLITNFIEKTPFLNLVGSYGSAVEALAALDKLAVQLIFLDIYMPELTGIEFSKLLAQSNRKNKCRIIFTTAFNQFAIEGYQVDALYYLLKPFNYNEFLQAANKGKSYFESLEVPTSNQDKNDKDRYLFVKSDYKLVRIDLDEIAYIESIKDYVKVHLYKKEQAIISLTTLKSIEERLPETHFLRIHRSFIVAINKIDALGRNSVHIEQVEIPVGDLYKESFKKLLDQWT
ncbi:MAG TPA: LytTR family DNA-binding domain-containing protein [Pseudosphingobacterium sp.]|nr:LytTR family DNA-binding domain-containing protein [Pseudosphingobacterium sp.]